MPTDIIMPQMGESIVEGTITKWLKKPGDKVQRDEPLFEISTDKVDAEIPSPASGVLQDIKVAEGTTVGVNTIVGTIAVDGELAAAKPAPASKPAPAPDSSAGVPPAGAGSSRSRSEAPAPPTVSAPSASAQEETEEARSSPLVRKIAREHGISLSQITGTGLGGRITKQDIMQFIENQGSQAAHVGTVAPPVQASRSEAGISSATPPPPTPAPYPGDIVPMSNMRKLIAKHMIESRRTSAHVHCMYEIDLTRIVNLRNKLKSGFEQRHSARLTFMPFFVRAAIIAIQQWPIVNANIDGDNIRYHRNINMGIAVALDWGLIVPVLKNAGDLNFLGLQRGISDLGERARNKKLKPEDVEGSTFTITNPGQFGAVFGLPIINQPNSAIMGVGGIMKQPMVVTDKDGNDSIAIRSVVHLTLGYDHRLIDGAVADQFMAQVKKNLETWGEDIG